MSRRTGGRVMIVLVTVLVLACGKTKSSAPPPGWEPDRSCASSDECRAIQGCCPSPCTSEVINARDLEKARLRDEDRCKRQRPGDCPQAGSCANHAYLCVRGRCALVLEGSPDWPQEGGAQGL